MQNPKDNIRAEEKPTDKMIKYAFATFNFDKLAKMLATEEPWYKRWFLSDMQDQLRSDALCALERCTADEPGECGNFEAHFQSDNSGRTLLLMYALKHSYCLERYEL